MSGDHLKERLDYIDWLRVSAVLLLFPYHTARIFCSKYFYVKNEIVSDLATFFVSFMNLWHMHLFMFLAGIGSFYALRFRTPKAYALERVNRLVIPLVFGILILIPPQAYYRLLSNPARVWPAGFTHNVLRTGYSDGFFSFYPHFFNGIFPKGNLEWGHLWFIVYLFIFSIIAIPVFQYLRNAKGRPLVDNLARIAEKKYGIFIFALPITLFEVLFRWKYPSKMNLVSDWASLLVYFSIFVSGYVVMSDNRFLEAIDRLWRNALLFGLTTAVILILTLDRVTGAANYGIIIYTAAMIIKGFCIWSCLLGFLGFGKHFLNNSGGFLNYAKKAAMPYYILHQTAVITTGFYVTQSDLPMAAKYLAILVIAFITTAGIYEIVVRRFSFIGFFFGMKTNR